MKVYLKTLGCRLNESEIEKMTRTFQAQGHEIVSSAEQAELCVINTCAVTNEAGRKSRQLIYQTKRQAPEAELVITGCYSEIDHEKVKAMTGVTQIIPNTEKDELVSILLDLSPEEFDKEPIVREIKPGEHGKTRTYVKIQDGCNNHCSFCVTTIARGAERSRPLEEIIAEVQGFERVGYQEIVLTGVHLGAYGRDWTNGIHLGTLIEALLERTSIPRIRLSSLEPWNIPDRFFELWKDPRLCRYLHLPLQSGSDSVLKRMKRRTRASEFRDLVTEIRSLIPDVAIASDMIVGFPGETEEEFSESYEFTKEMDFCHMHVFRYSSRPGTLAATMSGQVNGKIKSERSALFQALSESGRRDFYERSLGRQAEVLWEKNLEASEGGWTWQGLTDNYIRVRTRAPRDLHNKITTVSLDSLDEDLIVLAQLV